VTFQWFLAVAAAPLSFENVIDDLGEVADQLAAEMGVLQSNLLTWHSYRLSELDGTFASGVLPLPGGSVVGSITTPALSAQTCMGLSLPTQQSRRILKKFMPGGVEAQTANNGNWNTTPLGEWEGVVGGWISGIEATNGLWLWSYNDGKATEVSIIFPFAVTARAEPHVQRRRRADA
jgi:hypothetical protein